MPVCTIWALKGGVGKTTVTASLASCPDFGPARWQICLDPQADAAMLAGVKPDAELVSHMTAFSNAVLGRGSLSNAVFLLPDKTYFSQASAALDKLEDKQALKKLLASARKSYMIFIDVPPRLGGTTDAALVASDLVIVPTLLEPQSVNAIYRTVEYIRKIAPQIRLIAILPTRVDSGRSSAGARISAGRMLAAGESLHCPVLPILRERASLQSAQADGATVWSYPYCGDSRTDFSGLAKSIMSATKWQPIKLAGVNNEKE